MSKSIVYLVIIILIVLATLPMLGNLPPIVAYSAAWDAGKNPASFSAWALLESPDAAWIAACRNAWLNEVKP